MGKGSSASKIARLAARGRGKKIRSQGGRLFPTALAVVVVLGVLAIVASRHYSRADAAGPTLGTHWHLAYGIYVCDHYIEPFQDNKESSADYQDLQIHSHGDGVMHWHPGNELAINRTTGKKAKFKVFLNLYGVSVTDSKLSLTGAELNPAGDDVTYTEGKDTCDISGKPEKASLRVIVWDRYDKATDRTVRTSDLGNERIIKDQQVFVVAFVAESVANGDIPLPKWASELPTLGAADQPGATPTTLPGASGVPAGSSTTAVATTVAASTTVAGSGKP